MLVLEILGTLTGVSSVWLLTKLNALGWPLGVIYIVLSMILFANAHLYGELLAHVVFLALSLYGWLRWKQGKDQSEATLPLSPTYLRSIERVNYGLALSILSMVVGFLFQRFTNNVLPFLDSFVMSMSFAAMWLQANKKMENWILWMAVNTLSIGMYLSQALYVYALLYGLFLWLGYQGFATWQRAMVLKISPVAA